MTMSERDRAVILDKRYDLWENLMMLHFPTILFIYQQLSQGTWAREDSKLI